MGKIKKFFLNIDDYLAAFSLIFIVLITVLAVFMRYIVEDPLKWVEEASLALFVWFTFVGASSVTKVDGHVSIDFFVERLPQPAKVFFEYFKKFVMFLVFSIVLVYLGLDLAMQASDKITPVLGIKYTFIDIAAPIGGLLAIIHLIRLIMKDYKNKRGAE